MLQKNYTNEVVAMVALLKESAQKEILPRWGKVIAKEKGLSKGFVDIVTEADLESSKYILERIRKDFPGSYSEEHKHADRFNYDLVWQIDPVDGSQEFCAGLVDGYACHAALLKRQKRNEFISVAGIIYLPGVDTLWYTDGSGEVVCMKGDIRLPIPKVNRSEIIGYSRAVDPSEKLNTFYQILSEDLELPFRVLARGGSGASFADLLAGKVNIIVMNYNYTKEWDIAMAEPIIKALGGFICDLEGREFFYNRPDVAEKGEPYNMCGYMASIAFSKEEIMTYSPNSLLVDRLAYEK